MPDTTEELISKANRQMAARFCKISDARPDTTEVVPNYDLLSPDEALRAAIDDARRKRDQLRNLPSEHPSRHHAYMAGTLLRKLDTILLFAERSPFMKEQTCPSK